MLSTFGRLLSLVPKLTPRSGEFSSHLPENTLELHERLKSASATVNRIQSDVFELRALGDNIDSSLPELTIDKRDIARVVREELPSLRQTSIQIANEFTTVNRSISTLSQQVNALDVELKRNFSAVRQRAYPVPVMLEDTILTTLDGYFKHQAYPAASQCRSEEVRTISFT